MHGSSGRDTSASLMHTRMVPIRESACSYARCTRGGRFMVFSHSFYRLGQSAESLNLVNPGYSGIYMLLSDTTRTHMEQVIKCIEHLVPTTMCTLTCLSSKARKISILHSLKPIVANLQMNTVLGKQKPIGRCHDCLIFHLTGCVPGLLNMLFEKSI